MRFAKRPITRETVSAAADSFEVVQQYPLDKYLSSYLIRAEHRGLLFHVLVATDTAKGNIHIVTAYVPDPEKWDNGFRSRRLTQ